MLTFPRTCRHPVKLFDRLTYGSLQGIRKLSSEENQARRDMHASMQEDIKPTPFDTLAMMKALQNSGQLKVSFQPFTVEEV